MVYWKKQLKNYENVIMIVKDWNLNNKELQNKMKLWQFKCDKDNNNKPLK